MSSPFHHRWYLPCGAFALLAIGILAAASAHLRGFHRDLRARVERELSNIAQLKASQIVEWREHLLADAADLQHPASVRSLGDAIVPGAGATQVQIAMHRLSVRVRRNHLEEGALVEESGRVLLSTGAPRAWSAEERAAIAAAILRGTPWLSDLAGDAGAFRVVVPIPVARRTRIAAVFSGRIRASLPPSVRTWPSPARTAEAFLGAVHGSEIVILDAVRFAGGTPYPTRFRSASESPLALAARGDEGVGPALDHRGDRVLAARMRIPGTSWLLSAKESEPELLVPAFERERSLTFVVGALLLTCGAALVFWWRAVRADFAARERELAEQERQRAVRAHLASSHRLASLGTLAAGLAHEINNPLSYLLSNLEYVDERVTRARSDGEAERESLAAAVADSRHGARRIAEIVRTLRMFSRRERDGATPPPIDVREPARAASLMAAHQLRRRARLELDLLEVPPVAVAENDLAHIVLNLLVNAAQSLPEIANASRESVIRLTTRTAADAAVLEVTDTGCGIAPEHLPHIFDPFFTTRPAGEGTGLGLWVCLGMVERLGGRIEVDSQVGVGSTFRVVLPAAGLPAAAAAA